MQFQFITWALKKGELAYPLSQLLILGNLEILGLVLEGENTIP